MNIKNRSLFFTAGVILALVVFTLASGGFGGNQAPPETIGDDIVLSGSDFLEGATEGASVTSITGTGQQVIMLSEAESAGTYTSGRLQADYAFNALGLHWVEDVPDGGGVEAEVRFSRDGTNWGDWLKVPVADDAVPDHVNETKSAGETIGQLVFYDEARFFQYRLNLTSNQAGESPTVSRLTASYIDAMGYHESPLSPAAIWRKVGAFAQPPPASAQPAIISRAQWGADEDYMTWEPEYQTPRKQIIHHTVTNNFDSNPAATVRSIYYYHAVSLGWGDIGYNFLVDRNGNIYEGRYGGNGVIGGHALSWNYGSIGIAVLGDYRSGEVSSQTYKALVELMTWKSIVNQINPLGNDYLNGTYLPNYLGHRDVISTTCPGDNLYQYLPSLRNDAYVDFVRPHGTLDSVAITGPGQIISSGWAIDFDTTGPVEVHIYMDDRYITAFSADGSRPDVGAAYPGYGDSHGYSAQIDNVSSGPHTVCTYGINVGAGDSNPLLGCKVIDVPVDPFGDLNSLSLTGPNQINVDGWAIDPDVTEPIDVHLYMDGRYVSAFTADNTRTDVGAVYPGYGDDHGYSARIDNVSSGPHTVCTYAINAGVRDTNPLLGCKVIDVPVDPFGDLNSLSLAGPNQLSLGGWAIDPDSIEPIQVHIYVNGQWGGVLTANDPRADVDNSYPDYAPDHGFSGTIPVSAARNTVCAYGINTGPGGNSLLGCRVIDVPVNPFGNLEGVSAGAPGQLDVSGWALDPGTAEPIAVHIYVNGQWGGAFTADATRTDVGSAFPGYGDSHGFSGSVAVRSAVNTVCAYGINQGAGDTNPLLGCKVIDVPVNPFGDLNSLSLGSPDPSDPDHVQIDMGGWAIDPGTTGPIQVHIYVNGQWGGAFTADATRTDVGSAYPGYGDSHGFSGSVTAAVSGSYTVCAYGINLGAGDTNPLLGCRQI